MKLLSSSRSRPTPKNMISWLKIQMSSGALPRTTRSSPPSSTSPSTSLSTTTWMIASPHCWRMPRTAIQLIVISNAVRGKTRSSWRFLRMNSKRILTGPETTSDASQTNSGSASARSTSGTGIRGKRRACLLGYTRHEESGGALLLF